MAFFIYLFSEQGRKQTVVQGNRIIQRKSKLENLCDSWIRLGKLGSMGVPRSPCGCTLSLDSRGENSGPKIGKNESNNHIPIWRPIEAFKHV
jgi:hypothetical protein